MIIEANSKLWYHLPLPDMTEADVLRATPGARILTSTEEDQFKAVKVPTANAPIDINTANRYQLLTITGNDTALADEVIKSRPFVDVADFQNRATKLAKADLSVIAFGSAGSGGTGKAVAAKVINQ